MIEMYSVRQGAANPSPHVKMAHNRTVMLYMYIQYRAFLHSAAITYTYVHIASSKPVNNATV